MPADLQHPRFIRSVRHPGDVYDPIHNADEKEHLVGHQTAQRPHLDAEEITPREDLPVCLQEGRPPDLSDFVTRIGIRSVAFVIAQSLFMHMCRTCTLSERAQRVEFDSRPLARSSYTRKPPLNPEPALVWQRGLYHPPHTALMPTATRSGAPQLPQVLGRNGVLRSL